MDAIEYDNEEDKMMGKNGWILSGDVACIDRDTGAVKIIDRAKNIFKLS